MLDDGSLAPPFATSVGDFYGFMHDRGYSFFHCYAPERDLYFTVYSRQLTPEHIKDFEAILSREELRLAEYIEAARVAVRREIQAKLTGARFAGLEVDYGDNFDDPRHVYVVLNVTHEPVPGYTTCDCFKVALPAQPGGFPGSDSQGADHSFKIAGHSRQGEALGKHWNLSIRQLRAV
ncbi:MAG: hypothetical protein ACKO2G_16165 [Verrucomicrobiales bacterium]